MDKEIVEWHDTYSVGIHLIDEQHKELINITNTLYQASLKSWENSKVAFMRAIRGAVDYVGYHFGTEEKIMQAVSYPEYNAHKKEHADFVKEVLKEVAEFQSGRKFSANSFVYYLKDWVLAHIAVSDKKLGSYLIALKKQGSLQGLTLKVKKDSANGPERFVIK
jgi:hemerythrin